MKVRIKTREEFETETGTPTGQCWNEEGEMDFLYGATVEVTKKSLMGIKIYIVELGGNIWVLDEDDIAEFLD